MHCIATIYSTQNRRKVNSCREPHLREPPASCHTLTDIDWRTGVLPLISNNGTHLSSCGRKFAAMAPQTLLIGPSSSESRLLRWKQLKGTFYFLQNICVFPRDETVVKASRAAETEAVRCGLQRRTEDGAVPPLHRCAHHWDCRVAKEVEAANDFCVAVFCL